MTINSNSTTQIIFSRELLSIETSWKFTIFVIQQKLDEHCRNMIHVEYKITIRRLVTSVPDVQMTSDLVG